MNTGYDKVVKSWSNYEFKEVTGIDGDNVCEFQVHVFKSTIKKDWYCVYATCPFEEHVHISMYGNKKEVFRKASNLRNKLTVILSDWRLIE